MFLIFQQFRILRTIGLLFALGCLPLSEAAAHEKCSVEMSRQANELLIEARHSWTLLFKHQRVFRWCDDGELGEGYSDAVTHLLAQGWDKFDTFGTIANRNPSFKHWAVRHIDASASEDDLKRIMLNTVRCAEDASMKSLCETLRDAASKALAELEQARR